MGVAANPTYIFNAHGVRHRIAGPEERRATAHPLTSVGGTHLAAFVRGKGGGMSTETTDAAGETDAPMLREPHVRRVVDAARASDYSSTRRNYHGRIHRLGASPEARSYGEE
ncbi:MAG: hypothetical protein OXE73_04290 [Gammaproteobacteria bacterium]|nr:hypothetical protein [Gammaproteobacteria bacterium]